jgi:DNA/RNA-binding domain of Phe-tRNA-synthetase-like protein
MARWSLNVAPELSEVVSLTALEADSVPASPPAPLDRAVEQTVAGLRERLAGLKAGQMPHLQAGRKLYRAIGIDPTRHRPSPEALTRRVLRGDPFPRLHPAVDLANLWAVESGLPVGLYDLDRVSGTRITCRLGLEGESFEGIRKGEIHLDGRLALADERGPFGNPSSDSARTAVDGRTRRCLFVMFAPKEFPEEELAGWLAWLDARVPRWLEASTVTHAQFS